MQISFIGKRALVTGASRGIGRAIAVALAKAGAEVVAVARSQEALKPLCAEQKGVSPLVLDLSDWKATREAVQKVLPIQLLVNNAGNAYMEPFHDMTEQSIDSIFNLNFKAAVNVSQVVTGDLISREKPGAVVHISSLAGHSAMTNLATYSASKFALEALSRSMALELGPKGIRSNTVAPQVVRTELTEAVMGKDMEHAKPVIDRVPLGRASEVEEIVGPTLFLLSDYASMVNGSCIDATGGALTTGP